MSFPVGSAPSSLRDAFHFLLLAGCGIMGFLLAAAGVFSSWERYQTESWVAREAVVTKSALSRSGSARQGGRAYPNISVRFTDDGEEVRVAVAYGRWLGWNRQIEENARADVAKYPVGRMVTVYHPPGNTRKAVLERHPWTARIFLVPLGLWLLSVPWRHLLKRHPASGQGSEAPHRR